MLKALYNKIKSYLLCVKTNINNNKYNCKIYFKIKTNVETLNYSLYTIKGTQKGKVTCYARERVNKNKLF